MDGYWSTIAGEGQQQRRRRRERMISIIDIEPQRKRRRGTAELDAEFRRQVRARLVTRGLAGWPRAPLALDFAFVTTKRQPAGIEAYAKHYQDLLEPRDRPDDLPPFLYRSDRQIKMLFVRCSHEWGTSTSPYIALECQPRRHAIAELEAATRLKFLDGSEREDDSEWHDDLELERVEAPLRPDFGNAAREAEAAADDAIAAWDNYARYEAFRAAQGHVLSNNDRVLTGLFVRRAASLVTSRPDPHWRALTRLGLWPSTLGPEADRELLDIIRVPLPSLPTAPGGGARFREDVVRAFETLVARYPFLRPLLVPLRITFLVVPPAQGKDLDNIVLSVMSAVNNTLQPHPKPWLLVPSLASVQAPDQWRIDAFKQRRSRVEVGVVAYQVIELARSPDDPPDGTLSVVLGHGHNYTSTWQAAAHYVDKRLDEEE
jgi:hypothetical protein